MKTYRITLNFGGYIGCEETYEIEADSREEAEELARQEALDDLEMVDVEEDEDYDD